MVPLFALLAAGLAARFAAGLFGIGGGFVVLPALLLAAAARWRPGDVLACRDRHHRRDHHRHLAAVAVCACPARRGRFRRVAQLGPWLITGGSAVTFTSPTRGLVTADPTFELAGRTVEWLGNPVARVPLKADYTHDVRTMLAVSPKAGLFYICTPNNPTGTVTPLSEIEWLVANKAAGAIVLVDQAYTHFAGVPTASYMAAAGKDVIVMRTFSTIFGMAGMRRGYVTARPDLIQKMMRYDGGMQSGALPLPSFACANASRTAADLIAAMRAEMRRARAMALDHLRRRAVKVLPTDATCC